MGPTARPINPYAADFVRNWTRSKYGVDISVDEIRATPVRELHDRLAKLQEQYTTGGKLKGDLERILSAQGQDAQLAAFNERFASA